MDEAERLRAQAASAEAKAKAMTPRSTRLIPCRR